MQTGAGIAKRVQPFVGRVAGGLKLKRVLDGMQVCGGLISPDTSIGGKYIYRGTLHD